VSVNEHVLLRRGDTGYLTLMTDQDLLDRYRATREAMITTCSHDSAASNDERRAAAEQHNETLALIEARFPGILFPHSTAEWHLQQAIAESQPTA
jgi:hypothetical protein